MRGCGAARLLGCAVAWVRGCAGAWCAGARVCGCTVRRSVQETRSMQAGNALRVFPAVTMVDGLPPASHPQSSVPVPSPSQPPVPTSNPHVPHPAPAPRPRKKSDPKRSEKCRKLCLIRSRRQRLLLSRDSGKSKLQAPAFICQSLQPWQATSAEI